MHPSAGRIKCKTTRVRAVQKSYLESRTSGLRIAGSKLVGAAGKLGTIGTHMEWWVKWAKVLPAECMPLDTAVDLLLSNSGKHTQIKRR